MHLQCCFEKAYAKSLRVPLVQKSVYVWLDRAIACQALISFGDAGANRFCEADW